MGKFFGRRFVLLAFTAVVLLPLLAYAYLGTFSRYSADDYCTAELLYRHGLVEAQTTWYQVWSGRFSFTIIISLVQALGPNVVPAQVAVLLVSFVVATAWALFQYLSSSRVTNPTAVAVLLASLVAFATIDGAPTVPLSLYWQTGALTYFLPLVILSFNVGLLGLAARQRATRKGEVGLVLASFLFALVSGGLTETFAALQTAFYLFGLLGYWRLGRRSTRTDLTGALAAGLTASLLSMVVIAAAPGNSARTEQLREMGLETPASLPVFAVALWNGIRYFYQVSFNASLVQSSALCFLIGLASVRGSQGEILPERLSKGLLIWLAGMAVVQAVLVAASIAPSAYAQPFWRPEPRLLIIPRFVLVSLLLGIGYAIGLALGGHRPRYRGAAFAPGDRNVGARLLTGSVTRRAGTVRIFLLTVWLVAIVSLLYVGPIQSAVRLLSQSAQMRVHASAWDDMNAQILRARAVGLKTIVVPLVGNIAEVGPIGPDVDNYVNGCAAGYYDVDSIVSR